MTIAEKFTKTSSSEAKVVGDASQGIIEAFTNTMGIKDHDGDIIDPVAFNDSIERNLPIPVLAGHNQSSIVGKVMSARAVPTGNSEEHKLYTLMQFNLDTEGGRDAFSNVSGDYVREWSVGFNVPEGGIEWEGNGKGNPKTRRIKNLDWVETSIVIRGASPETATISAKSDDEPKTLLEIYTGEVPSIEENVDETTEKTEEKPPFMSPDDASPDIVEVVEEILEGENIEEPTEISLSSEKLEEIVIKMKDALEEWRVFEEAYTKEAKETAALIEEAVEIIGSSDETVDASDTDDESVADTELVQAKLRLLKLQAMPKRKKPKY
jgi:HK97 family phage prohead protease